MRSKRYPLALYRPPLMPYWVLAIAMGMASQAASAARCDVDADRDIDRIDIVSIRQAVGSFASGGNDPRDGDGDGRILRNDELLCALRCTRPLCKLVSGDGYGNRRPLARNDSARTAENTSVRINVIANDRDPDGRLVAKSIKIVTRPKHGRVRNHRNGIVTYTPVSGFTGRDQFRYRVRDDDHARSRAARVTIIVERGNHPPLADAGSDTNTTTALPVTLNGSGSSDPDGDALTFLWRFLSVPPPSTVTDASLANGNSAAPHFTPDVDGPYELALEASDGAMSAVDSVIVTARAPNVPPNANAGPDANAVKGQLVNLDGRGSADPDNGPAPPGFHWSFAAVPPGSLLSDIDIAGASTALASFTPDFAGDYRISLDVDDGADTGRDEVLISAALPNVAPNANAGTDLVVQLGAGATLDGAASNDLDSGPTPLSFQWTFVSVPVGSGLTGVDLLGATTAAPSFTPDVAGFYVLRLDASDGDLMDTDQVMVKANVAPVAKNDARTLVENSSLTEPAPGVLGNDTDGNNDILTAVLDSGPTNGTLTLNADGSFTYTPSPGFEGPASFAYHANDGSADSSPATVAITITHANEAPVLTAGATLNFSEGDPATVIDATVTVNDVDSVNLTGATVQITGNYQTGADVLSFVNTPPISGSFDVPSGTLTLSGADTLANYQSALRTVLYLNNSNNPTTAARTVTWIGNDGTAPSLPVTSTVTVAAVNDGPTITAGGILAYTEGDSATAIDPLLTVTDPDSIDLTGATIQVTGNYQNGEDVLSFTTIGPISGSFDPPSGTLTLSGTDTVANYEAALRAVRYQNTSGGPNPAPRTVSWNATDGITASNTATSTITIGVINDAPVAVDDAMAVVEGGTAIGLTVPPGATTVLFNDSDPDSGQTLTVTTTPTTAPTNGSVILSANGTFSYTHNGSETLTDSFVYEVCDNGSPVLCNTATVTIAIAPGNDAPALDLDADDSAGANGVNYALSFTEGAGAVTLSNGIGITDPDDTNLETAAVTLTNPQDGTAEVLSINSGLATGFGITATVAVSGDSIGLSGAATLDQYRQVLETVQYNHTSNNPTVAPARTITFTVNDGTVDSAVATATVTLNSINSAPSFTVGPDPTVDEDAGPQTVNSWATAISDGDGDGGGQTLTFNITNNTNAALFSAVPAISATGVLTYTPAPNASGAATITLTLSDDGSNTPPNVNTSASQSFIITVNAVNDAPSFTKGPDQTMLEDAGAQSVSGWATGLSVGPANESGQAIAGFNITGNTNTALFSAGPAVSPSGDLTYTPAANTNGSATITLTLSDNGSNTAPNVNTSAAQTFVITVTAVNDAPSFTASNPPPVSEDAGTRTLVGWATFNPGPANESGQTVLGYTVSNVSNPALFGAPTGGLPAVAANGTLTYTPADNANGSSTFDVVVQDSGGIANSGVDTSGPQTFTITVNAVNDAPVAQPKSFTAQANMKIVGLTGFLTGVLDADAGTGSPACNPTPFTLASASVTSPAGGTVTITDANTGTVDFDPPPGVTGNVTFTYTVSDNGCPGSATSAAATATVNVAGPVIWFVDSTAPAGGNGTWNGSTGAGSKAFQTVAQAAPVDLSDHRVFVLNNSGSSINYTNGLSLNTGEWLVGQGVTGTSFDSVMGISPPTGTVSRPSINGVRPTLQGTVTLNTKTVNNDVKVLGLNLNTGVVNALTNGGTTIDGVTVNLGSVTTATATAVSITGANNGSGEANAFTFISVSSNGAPNGIVLNNNAGSLAVTGTGAAGTGGTIQGTTGPGILLSNATGISLAWMLIQNGGDDGIRGTTVNGFTVANSSVQNNGNAIGTGNTGDNGLDFIDLLGTASISNSAITGSFHNNVIIRNSTGTLSGLTVTGANINNNVSATDGDGFLFEASGTANMSVNVSNSTFSAHQGDHFQAAALNSGVLNVIFSGNTLSGGHAAALGQGITVNAATGPPAPFYVGSVTYDLAGNTINGAISNAIFVGLGPSAAGSSMVGKIRNNIIGTSGLALSCSTQAAGVYVDARGNGTFTSSVTGNTIRQCADRGILSEAGDGDSVLNLTVTGNIIDQQVKPNPIGAREAIQTNYGITSTNVFGNVDTNVVCLHLSGNTFSHGAGDPDDFHLRKRFEATVRLPGYAGGTDQTPGSLAQVITFIQGQNTGSAGEPGNAAASGAGGGYTGGAACPLPP